MVTQVSELVSEMHEGLSLQSTPAFLDEFDDKTGEHYGMPLKTFKIATLLYQIQPIRCG